MPLRTAHLDGFKGDPTLLIWGDAAGMLALSGLLREAADGGSEPIELTTIAEPTDGNVIRIRKSLQSHGLIRDSKGFEWVLDADNLTRFADLVGVLEISKGHQYLEVSPSEAVTVMVSRGEYPDDGCPQLTPLRREISR